MSESLEAAILPYSLLVAQDELKLALELAYIAPLIGGVLVSGQRGTAKSTAVRAFARMVYGRLPVTLPINATDDRVVGGLDLNALMRGEAEYRPGLLEEANELGMLYIDEVNLLDDHIVNLILDAASTNLLTVQRDMVGRAPVEVSFTLVGTMNPEEGSLRPQLLDRFGLMTMVSSEDDRDTRRQILETVIRFDEARHNGDADGWLRAAVEKDAGHAEALQAARKRLYEVDVEPVAGVCAQVAESFGASGHRGDYVMALAARAYAALAGKDAASVDDLREVARMALSHRRPTGAHGATFDWTAADETRLQEALPRG
jgi:magnesium chelatase subunit I